MTDREIVPKLYEMVRPYRGLLLLAMLGMVAVAGLSAAQAYMMKPLIDEIFIKKDRLMLTLVPVALILLFVVKGACYYSYSFLLSKVGQAVVRDMRLKLYSHTQNLPLSFFYRTPTGELISRIVSDVALVQGMVSNVLVSVLKDSAMAVFLLGVIFFHDWQLALIALFSLPLLILPIVRFGRKHRKLSTSSQEITAEVSNILYETITGNRIVKAFCMEEHEKGRFGQVLERLFNVFLRDVRVSALSHPLMEIFASFGIAGVMWYGGFQVLNGHSTPGTFFSFITALIMLYEPLKGASKINSTVQRGFAASVRVFSMLEVRPDIEEKPSARVLPAVSREIEFREVRFRYDADNEVLAGINLRVRVGEVLAIVGSSGGGKTTMVNLIPRFCDVSDGAILVDGVDIREVTLHSLRHQIAMVTQQTILFNDTVRNNIAYGSLHASMEEIEAAAAAAHALDFIRQLPQGFDTVIGESGARLSGGERQRISIARAILKNAPILILDEATSALDTESERLVQRALENLMQNRTTFVIAHRLSTVRNADRIIVLQKGRIVEQGTHDQLLPRNGVYKHLYDMQFQK